MAMFWKYKIFVKIWVRIIICLLITLDAFIYDTTSLLMTHLKPKVFIYIVKPWFNAGFGRKEKAAVYQGSRYIREPRYIRDRSIYGIAVFRGWRFIGVFYCLCSSSFTVYMTLISIVKGEAGRGSSGVYFHLILVSYRGEWQLSGFFLE